MLGKLMKYDFKSMLRIFVPLWLLTPIIALLLSFSIRASIGRADEAEIYSVYFGTGTDLILILMSLLFFVVIVALLVMTAILIIQRFYNGLLKDEGYLMFTLPVEPWQLITAKGLTATIISFVSGVVAVLSCIILVMASSDDVILAFMQAWNWFWKYSDIEFGPAFWVIVLLSVIVMIVDTAQGVYRIYAAMAIGQLWHAHRVLGACLAYVGMLMAISTVTNLLGTIFSILVPDNFFDWMNSSGYTFAILYLLVLLLGSVILLAVFHVITEQILTKKLNLE